MNITGLEALLLLLWIVPVLILYFVVRLAVRHGLRDARRNPA
jgi:cytochrome c-type biogenesis protein CcmH/NrfF